jgi:NAD(P)-dependent dehydrogenase (short-subunit alcohol dehydrogenase family)
MKQLEDKVALVTGAASGIGKTTALLFANAGAKVVVSDVAEGDGKEAAGEIEKQGGEAQFVKADTSDPDDQETLINKTVETFGKLDIAVNNAGIGGPEEPIGEYPVDDWDKVISINLSGVFYGMKRQILAMLDSGGGSIVNMASILGAVGAPGTAGYAAAKHGIVGLTQNAALEYSDQGIRINAVGPGYVETPLLDSMSQEEVNELVSLHPIGRLGKTEEIAELVLWLASDKASFATGGYYPIDGGYLAQ